LTRFTFHVVFPEALLQLNQMNTIAIRNQFGFAGGSVLGSAHAMTGKPGAKNNQDAYHWTHGRNCSFAVVCDGCSNGANSEVGAQLTSRILTKIVISLADEILDANPHALLGADSSFWKRVEEFMINDILTITRMMGTSVSQTINDFWLCTIVGALITPYSTYIVAVGDGTYAVNDEIYHLKPEEGNSPTYFAYQITGTTLTITNPEILHLRVHNAFDTESVERILLASDGVDDLVEHAESNLPGKTEKVGTLCQFWDRKFFLNPDAIRRRLALIGLETISDNHFVSSPLKDDTTVITIVRHSSTSTPTNLP